MSLSYLAPFLRYSEIGRKSPSEPTPYPFGDPCSWGWPRWNFA